MYTQACISVFAELSYFKKLCKSHTQDSCFPHIYKIAGLLDDALDILDLKVAGCEEKLQRHITNNRQCDQLPMKSPKLLFVCQNEVLT